MKYVSNGQPPPAYSFAGGGFMFRKYQSIGLVMIGAGAGMLFACLFQSGIICTLGGFGMIAVGVLLLRKC